MSHARLSQRDDSDKYPAQSPWRPCIVAVLPWPASLSTWASLLPGDPHALSWTLTPWEVTAPPPPGHSQSPPSFMSTSGSPWSGSAAVRVAGDAGPCGQVCRREITRWPWLPGT